MRIVCPSCAAAYDVPSTALAPGRAVRCARCGTEWAPLAAGARPAALDPAARVSPERVIEIPAVPLAGPEREISPETGPEMMLASPTAEQTKRLPSRPRRVAATPLTAWIASVVLLIALAGAAYAWRAPIMAAWPPSERLYAALGLSVHAGGGSGPNR